MPSSPTTFPKSTTTIGFSIDVDYLKSEARQYFKKTKLLLSTSYQNISGTFDMNEQHHIIWTSFAFHHCALIWLEAHCPIHKEERAKPKDEDETDDDAFHKIKSRLYHLHLCSITTQLAWTIVKLEINTIYPLPPLLDDLEKVQKVHKKLQVEVCQLEATIGSIDNCPSFLVDRVRVLRKRIKE